MRQSTWGALALTLGLMCPAEAQEPASLAASQPDESEWLLNSMKDAFELEPGATLRFDHAWGDVRIEAAETDRVHVTAIAQYHRDDPRAPTIRLIEDGAKPRLVVEFAHLEVADNEAWANRRIDVGLTVPQGLAIDIETARGDIEAKKMTAPSRMASDRGDIVYEGSGSVTARSERGALRALLRATGDGRSADLSSLTGDIWCILLEGAKADIALETRGTVTTDYSVDIDRAPGSPLKKGRIRLGQGGTTIKLTSHSGGVRLQGLIAPESGES